MRRLPIRLLLVLLFAVSLSSDSHGQRPRANTARRADPLPSWNDGQTKQAVISFVRRVTTDGGPDFVPVAERIATFDNDGTLWCEQPVVQLSYVLQRVAEEIKAGKTLQQLLPDSGNNSGPQTLQSIGVSSLFSLMAKTHAGMEDDEFKRRVDAFFASAKHPTLQVPYDQVVYQPMRELLAYLRANRFKTYICSGGGVDFMRVISPRIYGIPPHQVIGTPLRKEWARVDGKWILKRVGKVGPINNKGLKAINIDLHIGQRPLLAVGNVRSAGDIAMLRYSQGRRGPSLQLLINHDDAKREFSYGEKNNVSLRAARAGKWQVVSMAKDWKTVFRPQKSN